MSDDAGTDEQTTSSEEPVEQEHAEPAPRAPEAAVAAAPRRLERSRDDRVIAGVCGGLAEYLGVDSVLVRIAAFILVFAGGAGILLYVIGWIAMQEAPEARAAAGSASAAPTERPERASGALVLGLVFVLLGAFFLVDEIWSDFLAWRYIWPVALIAVGAAILLRPRR